MEVHESLQRSINTYCLAYRRVEKSSTSQVPSPLRAVQHYFPGTNMNFAVQGPLL